MIAAPFYRIYTSLITYVLDMTSQGERAMTSAVAQELTFVQMAFFVGALGVLLWHLFVQGEDNLAALVKNLLTKDIKILMVGILVANGGFVASALAGVAIGQATDAVKLYASLGQVAKTVDIQMDAAIENMQGYPMVAARAMDIKSGWITQEEITRYGAGQGDGGAVAMAIGNAAKRVSDLNARAKQLQAKANATTDRGMRTLYQAQAQAASDEASRVQGVVQTAQDIVLDARRKMDYYNQHPFARWDPTKPEDGFYAQMRRLYYLLSGEGATDALDGMGMPGAAKVVQILRYSNPFTGPAGMIGKVTGFVDWITASPAYLVGYATGLLILLGVVVLGVTVIKESFAVATYIAGFLITLNLAASFAAPLAPIFFLGFLWEKTESYARSYVGFWFSAIFAAAGLSAMSTVVIKMIQGLVATISPEVGLAHIDVFAAKSGPEMLAAGLSGAAALICMGMCLSFILDLLKRGAAVGAGVWSGSFPT